MVLFLCVYNYGSWAHIQKINKKYYPQLSANSSFITLDLPDKYTQDSYVLFECVCLQHEKMLSYLLAKVTFVQTKIKQITLLIDYQY